MTSIEKQKVSLRKNDQVQVIAGREKGKLGRLLKVDSKNGRVLVEKVNLMKKHTKRTEKTSAGIFEKEVPLHYSNVLLFCTKCNRGVRHGVKQAEKSAKGSSAKIRFCKRCDGSLESIA